MGALKELFAYIGGLNSDDEDRRLPEGDVRRALNVRSSTSDTDNAGTVTSVKSHNQLLNDQLPFSGVNTCIGYAEDVEGNRVFLFYHNTLDNHSIISYTKGSGTFVKILRDSVLNFQQDKLINHANVLGDFLLWTADDGNPPRKINHEKARLYTASNGTDPNGYSVMDSQVITAVKLPPVNSPHVYSAVSIVVEVSFVYVTENFRSNPSPGDNTPISLGLLDSTLSQPSNSIRLNDSSFDGDFNISFEPETSSFNRGVKLYGKDQNSGDWFLIDYYDEENISEIDIPIGSFLSKLYQSVINDDKFTGTLGSNPAPVLSSDNYDQNESTSTTVSQLVDDRKKFQFATSFIYDDFEPSTVSPYSDLVLKSSNQTDFFKVRFETGHETVRGVVLYAREGNNGDWFKVKTIKKYDSDNNKLVESNSNYVYDFTSREFSEGVDQSDFARPFDYIPIQAKCQELLNTGNLTYGNYQEGYDPTDLNLELNLVQDKSLLPTTAFMSYKVDKVSDNNYFLYDFQLENYTGGDIPVLSVVNAVEDIEYFYNGVSFDVIEDMAEKIPNSVQTTINGNDGVLVTTMFSNSELDWTSQYFDYPTFKTGGKYKVGIIYYDEANRSSSVNIDDVNSSIDIPFYTQSKPFDSEQGVYKTWYRNYIEWEIKNQPPVWAKSYQVVYTDCLDVLESIHLESLTSGSVNADDDELLDVGFDFMYEFNSEDRIDDYTFQEGDRVRFISHSDVNYSNASLALFDDYLDIELFGFNLTDKELIVRASDLPSIAGATRYQVELYRPMPTLENVVYRERGQEFEVGNPGQSDRYHKGHLGDQNPNNLSQGAKGLLFRGDFYKRRVNVYDSGAPIASILDESKSISTREYLPITNHGRINIQSDVLQQRWFKAGLRHGGKFIPNTQLNNLLRFDFNDATELSEKYGEISKTIEVGYTLKVLQQYNVASVYIGRTQTLDSANQTNLALTNTIFGTINPSTDNYGCSNPESVRKNNRYLYFFDANNGLVIRDAPNGMIPISDYKMVSYFRDKGTDVFNNPNAVVLGNIDKEYKEYVLTFKGIEGEESVAFYENENRWKTFYDYIPDMTANIGDQSYLMSSNQFFELNKGSDYNNLMGASRNSEIDILFNKSSQKIKVYESVAMYSNIALNVPEITIPKEQVNRNVDRLSRLLSTKFERKEGVFYAELLKDMNTANFGTQLLALINGDEMRGQTIKFKLVYDGNEEMILESFLLHSNPSERSM